MNLEKKALDTRLAIFDIVCKSKKGHIGGAFSSVDLLVSLYYNEIFDFISTKKAKDKFILSKGHICIALYAILADLNMIDNELFQNYCADGNVLYGHPDICVNGVECTTGSLGNGIGVASGMALSYKMDKINKHVVALLGDGECNEGSVWEAVMFASHHKLSNLICIVDRNRQCATDFTKSCNKLDPFADKWKSFGWNTIECDGHNMKDIYDSFIYAKQSDCPTVIIAETIKGKGISFMEKCVKWHHGIPSEKEIQIAKEELK